MIVRELLALLGFKVDEGSHKRAESAIEGLKGQVTTLAVRFAEAFVSYEAIKGIYEMVSSTAELGEEIHKTSLMLGIEEKALQELRFAANQYGVDNEQMTAGLRLLARQAYQASTGSKEAALAFMKAGVSAVDSNGKMKPVPLLLDQLANGFSKMTNKTERTALAQKLFGRAGAGLIPLLVQGSAAIDKQRALAEQLGGVMDEDLIKTSEKYVQTQKQLKFAWQGIRNLVAKELLPAFQKTVQAMVDWIKWNRVWVADKIHRVVQVFATAFKTIVFLVEAAAKGFRFFLSEIGPVGRAIFAVVAAVAALIGILAIPELTLLGVLVLLGAVIDEFNVWADGGDSFLNKWIGPMDAWKTKVSEMKSAWNDFVDEFGQKAEDSGLIAAIGNIFKPVFYYWKRWIDATVDYLYSKFDKAFQAIRQAWSSGAIGDAGVKMMTKLMYSDPGVSSATRGLKFNMDNSSEIHVTVNAPGGDANTIADKVHQAIDQVIERHHRNAAQSFMIGALKGATGGG